MAHTDTPACNNGMITLENKVEIKVNRDLKELFKTIAAILKIDADDDNNFARDLINNKKQRSECRTDDMWCLKVMYAHNIDLDLLVHMIKKSEIKCWNQHIISSGLTKENIICLLSRKYDKLYSPDRKSFRSSDMQCIMSLYPYNIRFSDVGGYFEQIELDDSKDVTANVELNFDLIRKKFKDL